MATMGRYCKAYPIKRLREFSQWAECSENTRRETNEVDGTDVEVNRRLTDEDFLYLQENYVVTDGIFIDENVIFSHVTPEWKDFCDRILGFKIPSYRTVEAKASAITE